MKLFVCIKERGDIKVGSVMALKDAGFAKDHFKQLKFYLKEERITDPSSGFQITIKEKEITIELGEVND